MDLARGQRINHAASVKRKVFRLLNQARRVRLVGFGRINQNEVKDVFFGAGAGVKTISIIAGELGLEARSHSVACGTASQTQSVRNRICAASQSITSRDVSRLRCSGQRDRDTRARGRVHSEEVWASQTLLKTIRQ